MADTEIELNDIKKVYSTKSGPLLAVENINFDVGKNEFVSLLGPSGCGKSTIVKMLGGIIDPTSGIINLAGKNYSDGIPPEARRQIGFVFQEHNLLPWFSIRKNLEVPLDVFGLSGDKWQSRITSLLEMVNLKQHEDRYHADLSQSMQQRVGVIRAMVHDPEILLMDEPFGALDTITRENLNLDLLSLWRESEKTILYITHNVEEAVLLSSRVYVMDTDPGTIVAEIDVDLPRPRNLDMLVEDQFNQYVEEITGNIGELDLETVE